MGTSCPNRWKFFTLSKDSLSLLCWEYISQYYRVWSIMRQVLRLPIEFTVQLFTLLQGLEYYEASFTFADRVYGSTFFIATGFHGLDVIVGTIFLIVTLVR